MDANDKSRLSYWRKRQGFEARPGVAIRREDWRRLLVRNGALPVEHTELEFQKRMDQIVDAFLDHRLASERRRYHLDSDSVRVSGGFDE